VLLLLTERPILMTKSPTLRKALPPAKSHILQTRVQQLYQNSASSPRYVLMSPL
jgi:hypothetical protein